MSEPGRMVGFVEFIEFIESRLDSLSGIKRDEFVELAAAMRWLSFSTWEMIWDLEGVNTPGFRCGVATMV